MEASAFIDLGMVVLVAVGVSLFMSWLRQPAIIGYIITGILVGPTVFNLIQVNETVQTFSTIGVTLLLFMVGLGLNPNTIKEVGKVSTMTGVGQVLFTVAGGYLISHLLGFSLVESLYIATALAFSSTIIIMKLLSDKNDLDSLYGKISIGFLIIQDIIAMIILMVVAASAKSGTLYSIIASSFLHGIALIVLLFLFARYIIPKLLNKLARSQEELLLFSVGWCMVVASAFYLFDFSIEVGALLAGISLAASPYKQEISSKMKSLRDFFILLFFVMLGSQMSFGTINGQWGAIVLFSVFVLLGNPLIVMIIMGVLGYTKRTAFHAGLTVAQISEFSFILIALGISVGHLGQEILSFVTIVGVITIAGSSYMILYSDQLYNLLRPFLGIFEKANAHLKEKGEHKKFYDVLVFGHNRLGADLVQSLRKAKKKYLVIDFDPDRIRKLRSKGIECIYGDAGDIELLDDLNMHKTKLVVSTIPDVEVTKTVIKYAIKVNPSVITLCVANAVDHAVELYQAGATYVVLPHFLGGRHAAMIIEKYGFNRKQFMKERLDHIKSLQSQMNEGK